MGRPTFIGIGAQKCASTWVYDILRDHPQARLSERKELDFFSYQYERGYQWYEHQFSAAGGAPAVGEVSPSYFHEVSVPTRLRSYLPEARIIVSLRDPVERALSHHRHAVRMGDVEGEGLRFESALATNPCYLEQGRYATHLARWQEAFPAERILVLLVSDIAQDPASVARRVYEFLEIDPHHRPAHLFARSNVSHVTPHSLLEQARRSVRSGARRLGLGPLWELTAAAGARRIYHRINRRPSDEAIPPVSERTLAELYAYFRDEVDRLEAMIGRDLSAWRPGAGSQAVRCGSSRPRMAATAGTSAS